MLLVTAMFLFGVPSIELLRPREKWHKKYAGGIGNVRHVNPLMG
jgi:hypothetical protein